MKKCPYCGEKIQKSAKKCRFCGEWLEDVNRQEPNKKNRSETTRINAIYSWFVKYKFVRNLITFLYLDKNRISGLQYFAGIWRILSCLLFVGLFIAFPLNLLANLVGEYSFYHGLLIFLQGVISWAAIALGVGARIKQGISRRHDLGLSGRYVLLNWIGLISLCLIFAGGQQRDNQYGKGRDEIVRLDVEKKDLGKEIAYDGNMLYFKKNAEPGDECVVISKGGRNIIYVIEQIL